MSPAIAGIPTGIWVIGGIVAFVALVTTAFAIIVFIAALFSTEHADAPGAVAESDLKFALPRELATVCSQGLDLRFTGFRRDPPFDSQVALLATADGTIVMLLNQSRATTYFSFLSLLQNGRWILTMKTSGLHPPPNSKVDIDEFMDGRMVEVLQYHRLRLRETGESPVPFALPEVRSAMESYWRQWLQEFVDAGWARWKVNATCKFTLRGAAAQAIHVFGMVPNVLRGIERTKHIRRRLTEAYLTTAAPAPRAAPASATLSGFFVIARIASDGPCTYLDYSHGADTYLQVFSDRDTAETWSRTLPPSPGVQLRIESVNPDWLLACIARGYQLVLNAHTPQRRIVTRAELCGMAGANTTLPLQS